MNLSSFFSEVGARMRYGWAIRPEAVPQALASIMQQPLAQAVPRAALPLMAAKNSKLAVVPIKGVLTKDGPAWYGSNYENIAKAVTDAASNPEVQHIILSVDSPGGEVVGLPETAAVIAAAAKVKPVSAIVEGMAASAAYWLTSQANDITLTPSGEVGSVGVRMMHVDVSAALAAEGVKITELHSGAYKTEWSPYAPLTDDAQANMQQRLDSTHAQFLQAVSSGRGERASQEITDARYGEGRMFSAADAVTHGLVDKLQSSRDFYSTFTPPEESKVPSFPVRRARHDMAVAVSQWGISAAAQLCECDCPECMDGECEDCSHENCDCMGCECDQ